MSHTPSKRPAILVRRRAKKDTLRAKYERSEKERLHQANEQAARGHLLVNPLNLGRNVSYDTPDFVVRGFYADRPFQCKECRTPQVWTEAQQKWWYESAKGDLWAVAVLCRPCRRREQARKVAARKVQLDGAARKKRNAA